MQPNLRGLASAIKDIKNPIAQQLSEFEKKFREAMKSNVPLLDRVMYYIVQRKGKQMRPMFVLLCAKLCGEISERTYTAASLIELLHTATLVHDDVVDDAYERRGFFSINALWKNKIAVLVGDYLLAKGLLLSLDTSEYRMLKITSNAVKEMSEGELLQIEKARRLDIKEEIYYEVIRKKTASLIAAACSAGAASATQDENVIEQMRLFGETIGIAFQIKDDLLDFGDADIGKPRGIDIKERKMTLPLIYCLNNSSKQDKRRIINIVKNHNTEKRKVQEVIDLVNQSGGMEYAQKKMQEYQQKAFDILQTFQTDESSAALKQLVDYTIERRK
ncbi:MAG: polyprenyl synthetase family protein [Chitinophagales bacterium]